MVDTTSEQYNNISFHDAVVDIIPQFFTTIQNVMYGKTIETTYHIRFVHVNEEGYLISIGNRGIFSKLVENFPLHNLVYIEPIVTSQDNHSHAIKIILTNFALKIYVVVEPYVDVHLCLTKNIQSYNIIITKSIQLNPRGDLLEPIRGVVVAFVQHVVLYLGFT